MRKKRRPKTKDLKLERAVFWSLFICSAIGIICWLLGSRLVGDDGTIHPGTTASLLFSGAFVCIAVFGQILGSLAGGGQDAPGMRSDFLERRRGRRMRDRS